MTENTQVDHIALAKKLHKEGALIAMNKAKEIKGLQFVGRRTADRHLELLRGLITLEKLTLTYTGVTDEGLEAISGLTELRNLSLFRSQITDAGVAHLAGLTKLKILNLENTKVTDGCLKYLQGMKELERFSVDYDSVSDAGINGLKEHLPDCEMYR